MGGVVQQAFRQTFTVPSTSGSYAPERIAFGEVKSGQPPMAFEGLTANVDTSVTAMVVELWLGRVGITSGAHINSDYKYSGQAVDAATGMETWAVAGYPCMQIRVKSGGTGGSAVVSASAF